MKTRGRDRKVAKVYVLSTVGCKQPTDTFKTVLKGMSAQAVIDSIFHLKPRHTQVRLTLQDNPRFYVTMGWDGVLFAVGTTRYGSIQYFYRGESGPFEQRVDVDTLFNDPGLVQRDGPVKLETNGPSVLNGQWVVHAEPLMGESIFHIKDPRDPYGYDAEARDKVGDNRRPNIFFLSRDQTVQYYGSPHTIEHKAVGQKYEMFARFEDLDEAIQTAQDVQLTIDGWTHVTVEDRSAGHVYERFLLEQSPGKFIVRTYDDTDMVAY